MRILDAAATRLALPFAALIEALRTMFAAGCEVPPRQVHALDGGRVTSLVMPAWNDRHYGVKVVNIAPGNRRHGLPALHSSYLLHDATTGAPLALVDGDELTARRTAAASALAADSLARADATHLLVVGAGRVARLLPGAYRAVRPIERVSVWARSAAQAETLAAECREGGFDARAVADLGAAVAAADVVSCATLATAPLVEGGWLAPGSHLDLIGGFTPAMREADGACFAGASVFVDTDEALRKSGDLLDAFAEGAIGPRDLQATLADLVRGVHPGRRRGDERTVFKSVGTALEDLAAGVLAHETAAGRRGT